MHLLLLGRNAAPNSCFLKRGRGIQVRGAGSPANRFDPVEHGARGQPGESGNESSWGEEEQSAFWPETWGQQHRLQPAGRPAPERTVGIHRRHEQILLSTKSVSNFPVEDGWSLSFLLASICESIYSSSQGPQLSVVNKHQICKKNFCSSRQSLWGRREALS